MVKSLMSEETCAAIDRVVQLCFDGNSLADNVVYNLDVEFNMVIANDIVHHAFAHWFPAYADKFNDIQRMQNAKPSRWKVSAHDITYSNFVECFQDMEMFMIDILEPAICEAIEVAEKNKDVKSKIMLEDVYMDIVPYTKQTMVWYEKAIQYNENGNPQTFDKNFDKFTIIPIPDEDE